MSDILTKHREALSNFLNWEDLMTHGDVPTADWSFLKGNNCAPFPLHLPHVEAHSHKCIQKQTKNIHFFVLFLYAYILYLLNIATSFGDFVVQRNARLSHAHLSLWNYQLPVLPSSLLADVHLLHSLTSLNLNQNRLVSMHVCALCALYACMCIWCEFVACPHST